MYKFCRIFGGNFGNKIKAYFFKKSQVAETGKSLEQRRGQLKNRLRLKKKREREKNYLRFTVFCAAFCADF